MSLSNGAFCGPAHLRGRDERAGARRRLRLLHDPRRGAVEDGPGERPRALEEAHRRDERALLRGGTLHVGRRVRADRSTGQHTAEEQTVAVAAATGAIDETFDATGAPFAPSRPQGGTRQASGFEGSRPAVIDGRMYQAIGDDADPRPEHRQDPVAAPLHRARQEPPREPASGRRIASSSWARPTACSTGSTWTGDDGVGLRRGRAHRLAAHRGQGLGLRFDDARRRGRAEGRGRGDGRVAHVGRQRQARGPDAGSQSVGRPRRRACDEPRRPRPDRGRAEAGVAAASGRARGLPPRAPPRSTRACRASSRTSR